MASMMPLGIRQTQRLALPQRGQTSLTAPSPAATLFLSARKLVGVVADWRRGVQGSGGTHHRLRARVPRVYALARARAARPLPARRTLRIASEKAGRNSNSVALSRPHLFAFIRCPMFPCVVCCMASLLLPMACPAYAHVHEHSVSSLRASCV